jgi:hypothetical protein
MHNKKITGKGSGSSRGRLIVLLRLVNERKVLVVGTATKLRRHFALFFFLKNGGKAEILKSQYMATLFSAHIIGHLL